MNAASSSPSHPRRSLPLMCCRLLVCRALAASKPRPPSKMSKKRPTGCSRTMKAWLRRSISRLPRWRSGTITSRSIRRLLAGIFCGSGNIRSKAGSPVRENSQKDSEKDSKRAFDFPKIKRRPTRKRTGEAFSANLSVFR